MIIDTPRVSMNRLNSRLVSYGPRRRIKYAILIYLYTNSLRISIRIRTVSYNLQSISVTPGERWCDLRSGSRNHYHYWASKRKILLYFAACLTFQCLTGKNSGKSAQLEVVIRVRGAFIVRACLFLHVCGTRKYNGMTNSCIF